MMASRDHLKKIKKTMLLKICEDIGIDVKGKKTEELVNLLFTNGVPGLHVTPVVNQNSVFTGVLPKKTVRTWMHCPLLINVTTPVCLILNFPVQHFWLLTTLLLLDPVLHARTERCSKLQRDG